MKERYAIGIDPGLKTGVAIYDRSVKRLVACTTMSFWSVYRDITKGYKPEDCRLFIEDASLLKVTIRKKGTDDYQDRISRNVGRIQRESELLIEGFLSAGYEVERLKPAGEKWDDRTFQMITKWGARASAHARDAARFVFGM